MTADIQVNSFDVIDTSRLELTGHYISTAHAILAEPERPKWPRAV